MSARRTTPRGLSDEEAQAWAKLAHSVTPMAGRIVPAIKMAEAVPGVKVKRKKPVRAAPVLAPKQPPKPVQPARSAPLSDTATQGLDGGWERKLRSGTIVPDFTLDLHGHTLDSAHIRLDSGLSQALAMDARVVLLIAGKSRPVDPADRGNRRGAIRAKILDWLAAGPHGGSIAAIRKAHRRHGGEGALYLVLKRRR